ncbi:AmmeMemoRadiSam system protein B [Ectothiorhodospira shaposhnikovii]|uniref:AmmeMemoRadiSam system protein B n=1 Tax=Ectothiorhodospira shaposhnikovii TaxID=1054 RepID=UPI001904B235|nr:AmmeMemoRadiSam system protein B [Ectothiorhodospira shaposhnikovii]
MDRVRRAVVAGQFYPAEEGDLQESVRGYLGNRGGEALSMPKALIAPHGPLECAGRVVGRAYAELLGHAGRIQRVVLVGPSHRVGFYGMAVPEVDVFQTPLGCVPLDHAALDRLIGLPTAFYFDEPHLVEHSLEVQLPFLQTVLGGFQLLPVLVGSATVEEVAEALEILWGGPETLVIVSSDLSGGLDFAAAVRRDLCTAEAIEFLRPAEIKAGDASGYLAIQGLLQVARQHGLGAETLDLRNSADVTGIQSSVKGYGAFVFRHWIDVAPRAGLALFDP